MAETKKEEVVESTTQQEKPKVDNEVGKLKVKKPKMKKLKQPEDDIVKIDLNKLSKQEKEKPKQPVIIREKETNYSDSSPLNNSGDNYSIKYQTSFS